MVLVVVVVFLMAAWVVLCVLLFIVSTSSIFATACTNPKTTPGATQTSAKTT